MKQELEKGFVAQINQDGKSVMLPSDSKRMPAIVRVSPTMNDVLEDLQKVIDKALEEKATVKVYDLEKLIAKYKF